MLRLAVRIVKLSTLSSSQTCASSPLKSLVTGCVIVTILDKISGQSVSCLFSFKVNFRQATCSIWLHLHNSDIKLFAGLKILGSEIPYGL